MDIQFRLAIRPFLKDVPRFAYELVLIRSDGQRAYDRRLAILSGTDAGDLCLAVDGVIREEEPS